MVITIQFPEAITQLLVYALIVIIAKYVSRKR